MDGRVTQTAPVDLTSLVLDEELQPRAEMDNGLLEDFVDSLTAGAKFPPVIAFDIGGVLHLVDGFHRWHAHRASGLTAIPCAIVRGSRREAIAFALSANAHHGKRPTLGDLQRSYCIAVRNEIVVETDVAGVCSILGCSLRWAQDLTQGARVKAAAQRKAEIVKAKRQGKSSRAIAKEVGVSQSTVSRAGGDAKRQSAEMHHPDPKPEEAEPTPAVDRAITNANRMADPDVVAWHAVVQVLRSLNTLKPVEWLFKNEYRDYDYLLGPELAKAWTWLNDFHRRFSQ